MFTSDRVSLRMPFALRNGVASLESVLIVHLEHQREILHFRPHTNARFLASGSK